MNELTEYIKGAKKERARPPNKEQNWENKEQNGGKKLPRVHSAGSGTSVTIMF